MQSKSKSLLLSSAAAVLGITLMATAATAAPMGQDRHQMRGERMWKKVDANSDGTISSEEFRARGDRAFSRLDKNNDGKVTQEEMAEMRGPHHRSHGKFHHHRDRQGWFNKIDADHDGSVTKAEAEAARDQIVSRMKERTEQAFANSDKNNDGKVTKEEFSEFARSGHHGPNGADPYHQGEMRKRWFDMLDTDHDGTISKAESEAASDKRFAQLDADHNGKVTQEEMRFARETMHKKLMQDKTNKPQ